MDQSVENSANKKTPGVEKADPKTPQTLSALWDDVIKDRSIMGNVLRFLSHPFVLLGGLVATVYFLTRGKQHGIFFSENELREQNIKLLAELKAVKKKNKKLKAQLDLLSGQDDEASRQIIVRKKTLSLPSVHNKSRTAYLD